jgi:hypothetical protein
MLLGLDQSVYRVHIGKQAATSALFPAGPILAETEDALLLRRGPLRDYDRELDLIPDAPHKLLLGVIVVPKRTAGAVISVEAPRSYRPKAAPSAIGFVPAIERANELVLTEQAPVGAASPRIQVEPVADVGLMQRIVATTLFCQSSADWVMLPESCISPQILAALIEALAAEPVGRGLVIAGSGCHDGFNRLHVLGPGGRVLWTQDKLRLWAVPLSQISGWLHGPPAYPPPHEEATDIGDTITVIDLPVVGRILVAICEDLEREDGPLRQVIRLTRPDWILSPIFDTGTGATRWSGRRAVDLAKHGTTVIVAAPMGLALLEWPESTDVTIGLIAVKGHAPAVAVVLPSEAGTGIHRILPIPPP